MGGGRVLVLNGKERERGRDDGEREKKKEGKKEEKCKKFFCTSSAAAALHLKYFPSFFPFYLFISLLASKVPHAPLSTSKTASASATLSAVEPPL